MNLELTVEEAQDIAKVLGSLPTHANAHPLWIKVCQQIDEQLKKEDEQ